jgi:hypothetical protein
MPLGYFSARNAPPAETVRRIVRRKLAEAIAGYMRGEIDNFALDDVVWNSTSWDRSLRWLSFRLWLMYDDTTRHLISVDRRGWQFLRRCIVYLNSIDTPVRKLRRKTTDSALWPFESRGQLRASFRAMSAVVLPRYDPVLHHQRISLSHLQISPRCGWAAAGLLIAVASIGLALLRR